MFDAKYYMNVALDLARLGIGLTTPGPRVGAIIVRDGQIVGKGTYLAAGLEHAEILALNMAGTNAIGATLYVTLEPCNHHGKTPPCTAAIIKSGITQVIIASLDQNPLVSGSGVKALQKAGIAVEIGVLQEEADKLNRIFFHYITTRTPFITLKYAMSLDAKLVTQNPTTKWLTGENSRLDAHDNYRYTHDAIVVGINTILTDDPALTYRGNLNSHHVLTRIVLDTYLKTPLSAKIVTDTSSTSWIVVGNTVTKEQMANYPTLKIIQMPDEHIDLVKLMDILAQLQITSILVEGGATVLSSFLELGLFNQIVAYVAATLIGGPTHGLLADSCNNKPGGAIKLKYEQVQMLDNDLKLVLTK